MICYSVCSTPVFLCVCVQWWFLPNEYDAPGSGGYLGTYGALRYQLVARASVDVAIGIGEYIELGIDGRGTVSAIWDAWDYVF